MYGVRPRAQAPELRLEIRRSGVGYLAVVKTASNDEVTNHVFEHDPDSLILNEALWTLDSPRTGLLEVQREASTAVPTLSGQTEQLLKRAGQRLYGYAFGDRETFQQFLHHSETYRDQARLTLCLHKDAGELWSLPWEYLHDGTSFLGLSGKLLVSRLPLGLRELASPQPRHPVRVLVVLAGPDNQPELDFERELKVLQTAFDEVQRAGLLQMELLEDATLSSLQERLSRTTYDVLHYAGHAAYSEAKRAGELYFEDDNGRAVAVSAETLRALLVGRRLKLVVLSACQTAKTGGRQAFDSVATALLRESIPAVLAMQFRVSDLSAIEIGRAFYSQLAHGGSVVEAVHEARAALYHRDQERLPVDRIHDWGVPALYVRSPQLRLLSSTGHAGQAKKSERTFSVVGTLRTPSAFVGRRSELRQLRRALRERKPAIMIRGLGGIGKSALAAKLLERPGIELQASLVIRCDEIPFPVAVLGRIANFWREQRTHAHDRAAALLLDSLLDPQERASRALAALEDRRELILFDNLESWIEKVDRASPASSSQSARAAPSEADEFKNPLIRDVLRGFLSSAGSTTLVFTSRERWGNFESLSLQDRTEIQLRSLSLWQAVQLMNAMPHLRCEKLEARQNAFTRIGGHPKAIELLDSWISDGRGLTAVLQAKLEDAQLITEWEPRLLDDLLARLGPADREALVRLAILTRAFSIEAVRELRPRVLSEDDADGLLYRLESLSLLDKSWTSVSGELYTVHSVVRLHMLQGLPRRKVRSLHRKAAKYLGGIFVRPQKRALIAVARDYLHRGRVFAALIAFQMAWFSSLSATLHPDGALARSAWPEASSLVHLQIKDQAIAWHHHLSLGSRHQAAAGVVTAIFQTLVELGERDLAKTLLANAIKNACGWDRVGSQVNLGLILCQEGKLTAAWGLLKDASSSIWLRVDRQGRSVCYQAMAGILRVRGEAIAAEVMEWRSLRLRAKLPESERCDSLLYLAERHIQHADYEQALEYARSAEHLALGKGNHLLACQAIYQEGRALTKLGREAEAASRLCKALELARRMELRSLVASSQAAIGDLHRTSGRLREAMKCYLEALGIHRQLGDRRVALDLKRIASLHEQEGDVESALEKLEQALILARTVEPGWVAEGIERKIATLRG